MSGNNLEHIYKKGLESLDKFYDYKPTRALNQIIIRQDGSHDMGLHPVPKKDPARKCQYPGCDKLFIPKQGGGKFCLVHRAIRVEERRRDRKKS